MVNPALISLIALVILSKGLSRILAANKENIKIIIIIMSSIELAFLFRMSRVVLILSVDTLVSMTPTTVSISFSLPFSSSTIWLLVIGVVISI